MESSEPYIAGAGSTNHVSLFEDVSMDAVAFTNGKSFTTNVDTLEHEAQTVGEALEVLERKHAQDGINVKEQDHPDDQGQDYPDDQGPKDGINVKEQDHPDDQGQDYPDDQEPKAQIFSLEGPKDARMQSQPRLEVEKPTEEFVDELRESLLVAEQRVEHLTVQIAKVRKETEEELKSREKKYTELDGKLGKLQKRAKQRIQELQKEKEDVEAQLAAASEKASQASLQCTALQNDLERVRAQAGEALRSLDGERQQLRASSHKQNETIEDLQRLLVSKEQVEKDAQRVAAEREQMVDELTNKLMEMEEKHSVFVSDLVAKHQKLVEDLETQLSDAVQERTKATETISSLQMQLAQKESQIAELDAASSGEAIRLTASLEAARGDMARIEQEHWKEKEDWKVTIEGLKFKVEESENICLQQEIAASKARSQMESELRREHQALAVAQAELAASTEQISRLEKEFGAYKVRAYSLLQKKEKELIAAKDAEQLAEQEAAFKEAQRTAAAAAVERDRATKALQDAKAQHESQLAARSVALLDAEQRIRELAAKLESSKTQMLIEQEGWQSRVAEINASWQEKYNLLKGKDACNEHLEKEVTLQNEKYVRLKEDYDTFQEMANNMVESKDQEITRLRGEINELQRAISDASKVVRELNIKPDEHKDSSMSSIESAEQQIVLLARQQAQREEELAQCRRHIQALQDEIVELEHENRLHSQQESALKEELRNSERSKRREGVDMTYLKNVILKLLETGEVEALLPVIAMLLQFSPDELRKCQEVYNAMPETPSPVSEAPRTLLSRFMFSKSSR